MLTTVLIILGVMASIGAAWMDGRATGRRETQTALELALVRQDLMACYVRDADWCAELREVRELERLSGATRPC